MKKLLIGIGLVTLLFSCKKEKNCNCWILPVSSKPSPFYDKWITDLENVCSGEIIESDPLTDIETINLFEGGEHCEQKLYKKNE